MTLYHVQEVFRTFPGGAGLNGVTVEARLQADNSLITSGTTANDGFEDGVIKLSLADTATTGEASYVLHPGPYRLTGTASGVNVTRRQNSLTTGNAGALSLPAQAILNRSIGNGLASAPPFGLNGGEVTAAGSARVVAVDTFGGTIQGLPFWNDAARTVTISANASGSPRIDTVVVEMIPAGNATEGRCVLKVVEGTPASEPVAPTLTQTTTAWQLPLADVAVANGASVITENDLTDRRDFVERSVTAVEADVVQLQQDVAALQVPAVLVGYYQGAYNPGTIAAHSYVTTDVPITFMSGFNEVHVVDVYVASFSRTVTNPQVFATAAGTGVLPATSARVAVHNNSGSSVAVSNGGVITLFVHRLVTS